MTQNKNQNIIYTKTRVICMVMQCLNFFQQVDSNKINPKEFDLNKYTRSSSKGCVLEVDLEYPKGLQELRNDYPSAPDKIEIKREMLSDYQLKIATSYNIPFDNIKKLVPDFFDKEKYVINYENLQLRLRQGLKQKKNTSPIRI